MQAGQIVGCKARGQSVTIETGGQVELSGAPVQNLHQTQAEVRQHLQQAGEAASEIGVQFLGIGYDPRSRSGDLDFMPKQRYHLLHDYLQDTSAGTFGRELLFNTTSTQVCLGCRLMALLMGHGISFGRCVAYERWEKMETGHHATTRRPSAIAHLRTGAHMERGSADWPNRKLLSRAAMYHERCERETTAPLSHCNNTSFVYFLASIGCHCSNVASTPRCYATSYRGLRVSDEMYRQCHAPLCSCCQ